MRHIYRVLAHLYDPLGYLLPFTTRAKILVQQLWRKEREWDAPTTVRDIHIFCDASEHAYGAVAYLRLENDEGRVELSFMLARSRVSPK